MTVVAPRTLGAGIEAVLAATANPTLSKPSGSGPASTAQAALFPGLLGEIVDSATECQPASSRAAAAGSKATASRVAGPPKKAAGVRNRTVSAATTAATTSASVSQPDQNPVAPDTATARTRYPWPSQDGMLSRTAASNGPFSETGDTGGDSAAGQAPATPVVADGEAASSVLVQASQHAKTPTAGAELGQASSGVRAPLTRGEQLSNQVEVCEVGGPPVEGPPSARGEQRSNPQTSAAGEAVRPPAEHALSTAQGVAVPAQPELDAPAPQTVDGAGLNANGGADARPSRRGPVVVASSSQVPAYSSTPKAAVSPDERVSGAERKPAAPIRNMVETRPPNSPAVEAPPAAQADPLAADAADAATSLFARLVAPGGGRGSEPDRAATDQSDATTADGGGPHGGDTSAERGTLAFQALLVPAPAADPQSGGQKPRQADDAVGGQQPAFGGNGDRFGFRSTHDADTSLAGAKLGQPGGASGSQPVAHALSTFAPASSNAGAGAAAASQGANPRHASSGPTELPAWEPAEPALGAKPAAGGAAREVQLELRDADARVNIRLVERAGSVQVDVRTPDSHLAGSLRDDLPALTARLEQTGFRAETWHDAPAAAAARIKIAEPATSAGFQSSQNQSRREGGGHDPRDGQPQDKRQNQSRRESKEFSWLYTSLK